MKEFSWGVNANSHNNGWFCLNNAVKNGTAINADSHYIKFQTKHFN